MPKLISGSVLRNGGSGEFLNLRGAMPQLTTSTSTTTGFTVFTDDLLRTFYRSSLGNIEMYEGEMWSNLSQGTIKLVGTGTGNIQILGGTLSTGTDTGALVVRGGIGVDGNLHTRDDITVNGITIGQGYEGINNIAIYSLTSEEADSYTYPNGQNNVAIGREALKNMPYASNSIAIGRQALSSGTGFINSIAIGDNSLTKNGYISPQLIFNITGITAYTPVAITGATNNNPVVVTAVSHNFSTGTRVTIQDVQGLSTGSYSLVNNQSFYVDVLTADTFALYNSSAFSTSTSVNGTTTSYSSYSTSGTVFVPTLITAPGQAFSTGTSVFVDNVQGAVDPIEEYNANIFWVDVLDTSSFYIYTDNILANGFNGFTASTYVSGGIVRKNFLRDNNIAVGTNAGTRLYDGEQNFFFGDNIAPNLTTGSYNFFMGHNVATFMTTGTGNISIMGDNLVDGKNNQVNIGGVFYYNGDGLLDFNSDVTLGLGTQSTGTDTGSLTVFGGVGISHDLWVGGVIHGIVSGAGTASSATNLSTGTTGSVVYQIGPGVTGFLPIGATGTVLISNSTAPYWEVPAAITVGTATNANNVLINSTSSGVYNLDFSNGPIGYSPVFNKNSLTFNANTDLLTVNKLSITSTDANVSTTTGQALLVAGGVAVANSVRSKDGNIDENFLLYSPKVTVSPTPPTTATNHVGDFWIDSNNAITLQWVKDGLAYFWLQIGSI
jgi:hypothetical protein